MVYCQDEIDNYNALVGMSLLLTLCVFVMRRRGVGSAIFYFSLGIIKIIFGLLLLTVLYPEDCANFSNFYGVIAIFIGLQWIYYGDQVASSTPPAGNVAIPAATLIEMEPVHPTDINTIAPEQMQEPDSDTKSCYSDHCTYLIPMLGWFVFSGLLFRYNNYVYGWTHMAFPCPLLVTSFHFLIQFIRSYTLSSIYPITFGGDQVDAMSWNTYLYAVAIPCGLIISLDVGLSNLALVRITMTFYNMVKSSSPIFVVISAYCFGIEKITPALIRTVLFFFAGEMLLTVSGEVEFDMIGSILVLSAAIFSGMRWTVVQLKLQTLKPKCYHADTLSIHNDIHVNIIIHVGRTVE